MPRLRRDDLPTFYGHASVAEWLGVPACTISNWIRRYPGTPEPAGRVRGPKRDNYFWRGDQREDWLSWALGNGVLLSRYRAAGNEE